MKPSPTRTLNPLPFQDLEPHRFEDLVRQLAYGFRDWLTLEPTGKGGADDGMDIRGLERVTEAEDAEADDDDVALPSKPVGRLWIFQCKREKSIGPKEVRRIVGECVTAGEPPYGFVIAAACDFSKKARDAFREEMVSRAVGEYHLWGKSDLEDMLFRPENDRVLFGFFGISLNVRRQTNKTRLRSVIAAKKQLLALIEKAEGRPTFLFRDASDTSYPEDVDDPEHAFPRVILAECLAEKAPGGIIVIRHEFPAWISPDRDKWDAATKSDFAFWHARCGVHRSVRQDAWRVLGDKTAHVREFWDEYVPSEDKAWLKVGRLIPFERVVAIDPIGDVHFPVPHVFVEFNPRSGPFAEGSYRWLDVVERGGFGERPPRPDESARTSYFPDPIPTRLFPPPPDFDELPTNVDALDLKTFPTLAPLLTGAPSPVRNVPAPDPSIPADSDTSALSATSVWKETVLIPSLTRVIRGLEASGHFGRLATRSSKRGHGDRVEVRIAVRTPLSHNPDYLARGSISFVPDGADGVVVEERPAKDQNYGSTTAHRKRDELTVTVIEGLCVGVLERLLKSRIF